MITNYEIDPRQFRLRQGAPLDVVQSVSALPCELRWALQNALERIAKLEEQIASQADGEGK